MSEVLEKEVLERLEKCETSLDVPTPHIRRMAGEILSLRSELERMCSDYKVMALDEASLTAQLSKLRATLDKVDEIAKAAGPFGVPRSTIRSLIAEAK